MNQPMSQRSIPVQPIDFRKEYDEQHVNQQNHHHRHSSFNRKRYPPQESFHSAPRQNQNRGDWKRSRFDNGKANWVSQLDQELWDGPNVDNQRQNGRGGYRRGGRGGEFHARRTRDFPPTKERYTMKSESRFSAPSSSMSGENTMEPALAVERLTWKLKNVFVTFLGHFWMTFSCNKLRRIDYRVFLLRYV
jgi:hypothetical protein